MIPSRIVIFQTAFLGDVILTIPLGAALHRVEPGAQIAIVTLPAAVPLLTGHPDFEAVIPYDKHGVDSGLRGAVRIVRILREWNAGLAIVPHRSVRSALIVRLAGIPRRIGFTTSAGSFLFSDRVAYRRAAHEIDRNLDLLAPLGVRPVDRMLPMLAVNARDMEFVDHLAVHNKTGESARRIGVAPGSVWATKRWIAEGYREVCMRLAERGDDVVLIGGEADRDLCAMIAHDAGPRVRSFAGELTLMQSAALIKRCSLLLTNDSAPQHMAVAVGTPVVAIFGPTVPQFGFAPVGPRDHIVERTSLRCRPCAIHGGDHCPIGTFECMKDIHPDDVIAAIDKVLGPGERRD